jgi:hypothetical protein
MDYFYKNKIYVNSMSPEEIKKEEKKKKKK